MYAFGNLHPRQMLPQAHVRTSSECHVTVRIDSLRIERHGIGKVARIASADGVPKDEHRARRKPYSVVLDILDDGAKHRGGAGMPKDFIDHLVAEGPIGSAPLPVLWVSQHGVHDQGQHVLRSVVTRHEQTRSK